MYQESLIRNFKKFKYSNLMDDLKFRKVCESKGAIEEILRTVLYDSKLEVLEVIKQDNVDEPIFHGVILDCKCRLKTKEIVDIEIQISHNDNPIYRMRYNGSILTVENSPKKKVFKYSEIPKLILIMFCNFDIFNLNKPIYEIVKSIKGTNIVTDDGVREFYINLKAKPTESRLNSLFKIMTTSDVVNNKEFPTLSKQKQIVNNLYIGGEKNMNGILLDMYEDGIKDGIEQGIEQGKIALALKMFNDRKISANDGAEYLGISIDEFLSLVNKQ